MAYYVVLRRDQVPVETYWMQKTPGAHDTVKNICENSGISFSAVTTSSKLPAFSLVATQSHLTLKAKNPYLVVPSKLLEVAEVVGNLVSQGLVEDQLMGPALRARLAELESLNEARLASEILLLTGFIIMYKA